MSSQVADSVVRAAVTSSVLAQAKIVPEIARRIRRQLCEIATTRACCPADGCAGAEDVVYTCGGTFVRSADGELFVLSSSSLLVDSQAAPVAWRFLIKTSSQRVLRARLAAASLRSGLALLALDEQSQAVAESAGVLAADFGQLSSLDAVPCDELGRESPSGAYALAGVSSLSDGLAVISLADPTENEEPGLTTGWVRSCTVPYPFAPPSFGANLIARCPVGTGVFSALTGELMGITAFLVDDWYGVTHPVTTRRVAADLMRFAAGAAEPGRSTRFAVPWPPTHASMDGGAYLTTAAMHEIEVDGRNVFSVGADVRGYLIVAQGPAPLPHGLRDRDLVRFVRNDSDGILYRIGSVWPAMPLEMAWLMCSIGDQVRLLVQSEGDVPVPHVNPLTGEETGRQDTREVAAGPLVPLSALVLQPITPDQDGRAGEIVHVASPASPPSPPVA